MLYLKPKATAHSTFYTKLGPTTSFSWRRKWQPTPVFLPGESHGQRSLVGYNPRGHKQNPLKVKQWTQYGRQPPLPDTWGEIKQRILNPPELPCILNSKISKFLILKQNFKEIKPSVSFLPKFLFCLALARGILIWGIFKDELIHPEVLYSVYSKRLKIIRTHAVTIVLILHS